MSTEINENLERKIEYWKKELLDTGKRNRMINYRDTRRSTLRILDPEAADLFNRLAFSEKPLTFQKPINKDTDLRTYSMIALMETLSYTLNVQVGDIRTDGTIIEREKTLKNFRSKAKLAMEEQGTNILYLCFGFIYWREQDRPNSPWIKAPLLLMPVSLGLKSLNAPYTLSRFDDEIEVNPTLDYYFNTEYHIDLPAFSLKDRQSFDKYMTEIEELVDKRGWKVAREVSLGLLSFLKISMYHDLNEHAELMIRHPVIRAMAGDRIAIGDLPEEAENFDFDNVKPNEWHEVIDADSSQEEAILLSKLGVSFVMQGPPGTGKSQTITNIIAEALADGKKVLFVSEKAAALQVVLKRLKEVGLDDFCLSLHNYRANKKEIVNSIGANLNLEKEYIDSSALNELTELFDDRDFLNAYAEELHQTDPALKQSVYMVFGKILKLKNADAVEFSIEKPEEVSQEKLASFLYSVSAFEKALRNIGGRLSDNPWFGTKAVSSGQVYKEQLLKDTEGLSENLRRIHILACEADVRIGSGMTECYLDIMILLHAADIFNSCFSYISPDWFKAGAVKRGRACISEAKVHSERMHEHKNAVLNDWDRSVLDNTFEDMRGHFRGAYSWIYSSGGSTPLKDRWPEEQAKAEKLKAKTEMMLAAFFEGLKLMAYDREETLAGFRMVSKVLSLSADAPFIEKDWFDTRKNAEMAALADAAVQHGTRLSALSKTIFAHWDASVLEIDAYDMLARFKLNYTGLFHSWRADYREDIRTLRRHSKHVGVRFEDAEIIRLLQDIIELKAEKVWFRSNSEALSSAAGARYHGEETDWNLVRKGLSAADQITKEFPYLSVPEETAEALIRLTTSAQLSGDARRIADVLSPAVTDQLEKELQSLPYIHSFACDSDLSEFILPQIYAFIGDCSVQEQYVSKFVDAKKNGILTCGDIESLLSDAEIIHEEQGWFTDHKKEYEEVFAGAYREDRSDWKAISGSFDAVDGLSELFRGAVSESVIDHLSRRYMEQDTELINTLDLIRLMEDTLPKLQAFSDQFSSDDFMRQTLESVADRYDACINGFTRLNEWLDYTETREECDKLGLGDFTKKIAELDNQVQDVRSAFERGFYIQWLNQKLNGLLFVKLFRRRIHDQKTDRFVQLDTKQYETARKTIREKIISTYPDPNKTIRGGSELRVLKHEMEKKRQIMPLRKLFRSIPKLLLTLKPCLMMSPLSVAYFLDAEAYQFDMVIFDEASQIFPQDAIGAIFRAKQVIIAGDTQQLPPTNFFAVSTSNASDGYDDDEGYDEEVYDSILEETANILPNRTLLWHYRSKHEHLIAFSNREIYRNDLVTFPSSNESDPDTGVEFVYVADGYYEPSPRNCNMPEARRIVELVAEHIEKYPERSLGVIAFSEKQQQAITLEIQRFREKNPKYEAFFAEGKDEEFFVKNLENVQGDERDTIFFSIGYARTKEQIANGRPMSMRFGPLGVVGGERRLNVAITRAKINVKLVSSILPSDIDLSRTESEGVRMLRSYIEYARNSEATLADAHKNSRPDDFVDVIAQFLRARGFKVQQYVGCSNYRIDIAVEHPYDGARLYAAGIECDGFSYISAKTARDRDRLRSTVLKNMGWNLYRVWSAEWYKNPEVEGEKLITFVNAAIRSCDGRVKAIERMKEAVQLTDREDKVNG